MSTLNTDSYLSRNLRISWIIFFLSYSISFAQSIPVVDTLNSQTTSSLNTMLVDSAYQNSLSNYYKTDSIFSFHSPKGYFPSLISNFGIQAISPLHFKTKEWMLTCAATGITVALLMVDKDIDDWSGIQKEKHRWINKSSPIITEFGNKYGIYLLGAIGSLSEVCKKQKGVQTSLLASQAMITSGVWVQLIKTLTGRERPKGAYLYSQLPGGKWYGPFARFDKELAFNKSLFAFDAFPSGHTAMAFSFATVFASQYSDKWTIPIISYSAATLVGLSRLTEKEHWASDVFVGAFVGYICGKQVVKHFNDTHQNNHKLLSSKRINETELKYIQNGSQIGFSLKW